MYGRSFKGNLIDAEDGKNYRHSVHRADDPIQSYMREQARIKWTLAKMLVIQSPIQLNGEDDLA